MAIETGGSGSAAGAAAIPVRCRLCDAPLTRTVIDLGMSPLCESFLAADQLDQMEPFYPLILRICDVCLLVQLAEYVAPEEIFTEYAYFSSFSSTFVENARTYAVGAAERLGLGGQSQVLEIASNDGYLLQHFVAIGIPVLGIEPAENITSAAIARGVPTRVGFFGVEMADELIGDGMRADLVIANNVLSQAPHLNDFVAGMKRVLAPDGVATVEFPHLLQLLTGNLYDTIYHEHFTYFSLSTSSEVFRRHGLEVFDVDEIDNHGGSLRLWLRHAGSGTDGRSAAVDAFLERERAAGLGSFEVYESFASRVESTKRGLLEQLIGFRRDGLQLAAYGAPGKANTMLNYCGIRTDLLAYTVDRNPYKHGRFTPGTHIPIHPPEHLAETKPDVIWVLPWNLEEEIVEQLSYAREWGARFMVALPDVRIRS